MLGRGEASNTEGVGLLLSMRLGKSKLAHACMPGLLHVTYSTGGAEGCAHLEQLQLGKVSLAKSAW